MSAYVWCEDRGSGFQFWTEIFKTLYPDIIVQSKNNNSNLRKAVSSIEDDGNDYYILMDSFMDNADVLREFEGMKRCASKKKNVHIVDIYSFEYAILTFQAFDDWIFDAKDELKEKRKDLLLAKNLFVEQVMQNVDMEKKNQFELLFPYVLNHNNEQVAAELLYQITRNTGFETNKGNLGDCLVVDCCGWILRKSDDLCGLDKNKPSADEKKRQLVSGSMLKNAFEKVGL